MPAFGGLQPLRPRWELKIYPTKKPFGAFDFPAFKDLLTATATASEAVGGFQSSGGLQVPPEAVWSQSLQKVETYGKNFQELRCIGDTLM